MLSMRSAAIMGEGEEMSNMLGGLTVDEYSDRFIAWVESMTDKEREEFCREYKARCEVARGLAGELFENLEKEKERDRRSFITECVLMVVFAVLALCSCFWWVW